MKKIIFPIALLSTYALSNAQIRLNTNTSTDAINGTPVFMDVSSSTAFNGSANNGKGFVFPSADLSALNLTVINLPGSATRFPTYLDGMIVYNTNTSPTSIPANAGSLGHTGNLKRGFYYYDNPAIAGRNLITGKWRYMGSSSDGKTYIGSTGIVVDNTGNTIGLTPGGTANQYLNYLGQWITLPVSTDTNTTYSAGTNISLDGTTFNVPNLSGDVTGSLTNTQIAPNAVGIPELPAGGNGTTNQYLSAAGKWVSTSTLGKTYNNGRAIDIDTSNNVNARTDNSTINVNGANNLYVPTGGITTIQILDGTIQNADIADNTIQPVKISGASTAGSSSYLSPTGWQNMPSTSDYVTKTAMKGLFDIQTVKYEPPLGNGGDVMDWDTGISAIYSYVVVLNAYAQRKEPDPKGGSARDLILKHSISDATKVFFTPMNSIAYMGSNLNWKIKSDFPGAYVQNASGAGTSNPVGNLDKMEWIITYMVVNRNLNTNLGTPVNGINAVPTYDSEGYLKGTMNQTIINN